jgi:DnaJ-class molecular chaperone
VGDLALGLDVPDACMECDGYGYFQCWPHTTCRQCGGSGIASIEDEDFNA